MTADQWLEAAVCANTNHSDFYASSLPGQQRAINAYCARCPVRAECLADALTMPQHVDQGVRAGLTGKQRRALRERPDLPTGQDPVTIAALRRLLDEEHPITPPPAPRPPRKEPAMYTKPAPAAEQPTIAAVAEPLGDGINLLAWAEQHDDPAVRKLAQTASAALAVIRQRHATDAELATVEREAAQLRDRLAELDARAKELKPSAAKPKRDYDPATVRAWAKEQGVPCPGFGQIPKAVLEAWRGRNAS